MFNKSYILFSLLLALSVASTPAVVARTSLTPNTLTKSYHSTNGGSIARADQNRAAQLHKMAILPTERRSSAPAPARNQVVIYTANVMVGDVRNVELLIDTGSSTTSCAQKKCPLRNETGQDEVLLYGSAQFLGLETMQPVEFGQFRVQNQSVAIGVIDNGLAPFDGILGLGPTDLNEDTRTLNKSAVATFSDNLASEGSIQHKVVGIYYAPTLMGGEDNGEITFGTFDRSKCSGELKFMPITTTSPSNKYWGIDASITYNNEVLLALTAGIVDTGTSLVLLSTDAFRQYMKATNATVDQTTGLLSIPASSYSQLHSLKFQIGGFTFEMTPDAQVWPRSLNNCIGGKDDTIYLIVGDIGTNGASGLEFILGYTFLERSTDAIRRYKETDMRSLGKKSSFDLPTMSLSKNTADSNAKTASLTQFIADCTPSQQMTTDQGLHVADTDNWLRVASESTVGPALLEDHLAREKIMRFDHERIPERVVHARGAGAHGYFKAYDSSAERWTKANVLIDASRVTPVFVRFSTVQGSRGSADTVRDVRGFAVKFYTEEGNWDIVGNNIPVFFIQDAIKFPDIIHAVKPEPQNEVPTGQSAHNNFWDFVGLQPESAHMIMWVMSDRAIPRSYRMMQGFGVNTYTLLNAAGETHFVKFHWIPELGVHSLVWDEALKIAGQDPDFHRKDLNEAIESGAYPKWRLAIQVIPEKDEHKFDFDILDATKIWPEELVPLHFVGEMVLNKVVDEYFSEVEQVAFCTSNVVPGIGFSDDPLLQGRNFSYLDTQLSRLGVNWQQIPINRPVCPVMNFQRDGQMQMKIHKGTVNYWPNRLDAVQPVAVSEGGYHDHVRKISGMAQRMRSPKFNEHYSQAQLFYNSLSPTEQAHLQSALAFELSHCEDPIVYRNYINVLNNIDYELAKYVAVAVGGDVPDAPGKQNEGHKSAKLSQVYYAPKEPTIKGRRVAILLADGFDKAEVVGIKALIASASANAFVIGPRRGKVFAAGEKIGVEGGGIDADHHFEGQRSTMFDALVIPSGEHAALLMKSGRAVHWLREAFGHCKPIGAVGEAILLVQEALNLPEVQYADPTDSSAEVVESYGVVTTAKYDVTTAIGDALKMTLNIGEKGFMERFAFELSKHRCFKREEDGLTARIAY
ncbi:Catalase [Pleurotus pulmonarius]